MSALCKRCRTNWPDVAIVFLFCLTVLIVVCYAICNYFKWKENESHSIAKEADTKRNIEKEVNKSKQQAEFINMLLKFEEKLTDKETANKLEENACKTYIKDLKDFIKTYNLPEQ